MHLHYFAVKQPDLKWENPKLRQEIYAMMHFWFQKGVDGFRMDVIPFISKDTTYPELDAREPHEFIAYYANGPELHTYLHEMHQEVIQHYDVMTVGEGPGIAREQALDFVADERQELDMFFHFDLMSLDRKPGEVFTMREDAWKLTEFKQLFSDWDTTFAEKGWGSLFLANHDFPRAVSRWGNDHPEHWRNSATLLHTFLLTMRGTPYFYQGDEIGITNVRFTDIDDYRDINTINRYAHVKKMGGDLEAFMESEQHAARENARTPMHWSAEEQAGFTSGTPWIRLNPNYASGVNVADQEGEQYSVLNYFRKMVTVRKQYPTLVYGAYTLLDPEDESIYAYLRTRGEQCFLVLLNFSTETVHYTLPPTVNYNRKIKIISNGLILDDQTYKEFLLGAWQAVVYRLED